MSTLGRAPSPIAKFRKDFGPHPVFGGTLLFGAIARLQLNTAVAELKVVCGDDTPRRAMIEHRRTWLLGLIMPDHRLYWLEEPASDRGVEWRILALVGAFRRGSHRETSNYKTTCDHALSYMGHARPVRTQTHRKCVFSPLETLYLENTPSAARS